MRLCEYSEMDRASQEIPVLVRTDQEISPANAHGYLRDKENATALPPIYPLGGTAFLYHNPGKEGARIITIL